MSDYRVNIKVRNARLLRAIEDAGHQPGAIFARLVGISYSGHLLAYLNLKRTPFDDNGDLKPCAENLCTFFNSMPDALWSQEQRHPLVTNAAEVDLCAASVHELLCAPPSCVDPLVLLEQRETVQGVDDLLDWLPMREAEILRLRFGIGCQTMTLQEVVNTLGSTRARIQQLEKKALNRLRMLAHRNAGVAALVGMTGSAS